MERETGFEPATLSLGSSENKLILLDLDGHFSRFSDQFSKRAPHRLLRLVPRTISCAQIWLLSSVELPQPEVSTCSRKDQVLRKAIPDPAPGIRDRWWSTDLSHDLVMIGCQAIASGQTVPGSRLREHATGQTGLYCKPNETSACEFSGGTGHGTQKQPPDMAEFTPSPIPRMHTINSVQKSPNVRPERGLSHLT